MDIDQPVAGLVLAGTWQLPKTSPSASLHSYRRDQHTGGLDKIGAAAPGLSIGNACLEPRRNVLYCTDEDTTHPSFSAGGGGRLLAFSLGPDGTLTELNWAPSYGSLPSDVEVDATGAYLVATNHSSAAVVTQVVGSADTGFDLRVERDSATTVLYALEPDGSIGQLLDVIVHDPPEVEPERWPQIHSVTRSPSGFFVVCDKGGDRVWTMTIDRTQHRLSILTGRGHQAPRGSAPRYSAFHPTRNLIYVNHEGRPDISVFEYSPEGELRLRQTISVLPEGTPHLNTTRQSDIRCHPTGNFVYSLLRGLNAVAILRVDDSTDALTLLAVQPLDCDNPRGCAISPDGRFLYVAGTGSDAITIWRIADDGRLSLTASLPSPAPGTIIVTPEIDL